jgi:hypothetical protein
MHTIEGTFKVRNLYEKTFKIYKFKKFEHVVLCLNPKLLNKSAVRWGRGTFKTQNFKILT